MPVIDVGNDDYSFFAFTFSLLFSVEKGFRDKICFTTLAEKRYNNECNFECFLTLENLCIFVFSLQDIHEPVQRIVVVWAKSLRRDFDER